MYCPECGSEERQTDQFCRTCGYDLRAVKLAIQSPERLFSGGGAHEEIGRAVAAKIREADNIHDLKKVVERVLPQLEKYLESPEEKRLRRLRTGTVMSCIGIGAGASLSAVALIVNSQDLFFLAGMGFINFFIGLAIILNGLFLTVPKRADGPVTALQESIWASSDESELRLASHAAPSVTEHTTHSLTKEPRR